MKWIVAALLLAGAGAGACSVRAAAKRPKLIVAISVDQFSAQLFEEYRPHFTGGLRRLADGIAFANGYQAHAATETCPGHSTILTGDHPARTGVIANLWYDFSAPRSDKAIYCAEDERAPGSTSLAYAVSDVHLRVPTIGDRMKKADSASRVVVVAGKDRAAVMMGGHHPDQRWWWRGSAFVQSGTGGSPIAEQVNAAIARSIATATPALEPPPVCTAKERAIDLGEGRSVGTFHFQRAAGDGAAYSSGPELDAATLAMAAAFTQGMKLGRGKGTDLLAIGLSATDLVGHRYGPGGVEMCLQLLSLDRDLGGFLDVLDRTGVEYVLVLTADHGGLDLPERGQAGAARLDPAASVTGISSAVASALGLPAPVLVGDWYVNATVPPARRGEVLEKARQLLTRHPQVEAVYSKAEIAAHAMPTARPENWSVLDRLRASFDAQRSGDLAVVYKPNVTPIPKPIAGYVATHGSVWDYDRKVPILFWWPGIMPQDRSDSAMTVDILPTLASLIGLNVRQSEIDGHCLDLKVGTASKCR